ncbi:predicted protein [Histoplasma capsulatum H143]|uniref:Uncharacterized protein n=1 Tax=Ajellomyces capsulatus (strain H143) TaxID=544712 RepID=C6HT55_AJECH|nr:predicted protein [Histoplasma capsulatum H143]
MTVRSAQASSVQSSSTWDTNNPNRPSIYILISFKSNAFSLSPICRRCRRKPSTLAPCWREQYCTCAYKWFLRTVPGSTHRKRFISVSCKCRGSEVEQEESTTLETCSMLFLFAMSSSSPAPTEFISWSSERRLSRPFEKHRILKPWKYPRQPNNMYMYICGDDRSLSLDDWVNSVSQESIAHPNASSLLKQNQMSILRVDSTDIAAISFISTRKRARGSG